MGSMNEWQKDRCVIRMVKIMFRCARGKAATVFGFAFKKNTSDCRESPAVDVCRVLFQEGANIQFYGPKVSRESAVQEMKRHHGFEDVNWENQFISAQTA